jgi:hypothetical protein
MGALASSFSGLSSNIGKALGNTVGKLPGMGALTGTLNKATPGFVKNAPGLKQLNQGLQGAVAAKQQPGVPPAMQALTGMTGSPAQGQGGAPVVPGAQSLAMTPQTAMGGVAPTPPGQQFPRKLLGQQGGPGGPDFPTPMA